jgi:hypothetical protein
MPFDPTLPATGSEITSAELRSQFNALNDRLNGASAALDWSNGAPKLPEYTALAAPVLGNIAFDYSGGHLMYFDGGDWQQL